MGGGPGLRGGDEESRVKGFLVPKCLLNSGFGRWGSLCPVNPLGGSVGNFGRPTPL